MKTLFLREVNNQKDHCLDYNREPFSNISKNIEYCSLSNLLNSNAIEVSPYITFSVNQCDINLNVYKSYRQTLGLPQSNGIGAKLDVTHIF